MDNPVFLFNPANRRFISGKKGRYAPGSRSPELTWQSAPLFLVPFLIFGVFGFYSYHSDLERAQQIQQLTQEGVMLMGYIRSCHEARGLVSIRYWYTVANADGTEQQYAGWSPVDVSNCRPLQQNTPVEILYLPDTPGVSKLAHSFPSTGVSPIWLILSVFGFGFSVLSWAGIILTEWRLWQLGFTGILLQGQIVSSQVDCWRKQYFIESRYRFRLPDGTDIESVEQSNRSSTPLQAPPPGTEVRILFCSPHFYRPL